MIWPAISIPLVWLLVRKTAQLSEDPVILFEMMLMTAGLPGTRLSVLVNAESVGEGERDGNCQVLDGEFVSFKSSTA